MLLALTARQLYVIDEAGWWPFEGAFHAIGSGADAALAALHMGASAEQAVEVAIKVDQGSGPPIGVLRVSDIPVR
jgi:20S proteasome alpha/beta subunit